MAKKHPTDWIAIEKDFRAGVKSNLQIAREHKISESSIRKKAKDYEWKKDLANAIRARAEQLVQNQKVREELRAEIDNAEIIESNAQLQATVIREHRTDIKSSRSLVQVFLMQLNGSVVHKAEFEELAEILATKRTAGIEDSHKAMKEQERLLEIFTKFMQLPSQSGTLKQLTDSLKTLIGLEREAFGIDQRGSLSKSLEDFLEELDASA